MWQTSHWPLAQSAGPLAVPDWWLLHNHHIYVWCHPTWILGDIKVKLVVPQNTLAKFFKPQMIFYAICGVNEKDMECLKMRRSSTAIGLHPLWPYPPTHIGRHHCTCTSAIGMQKLFEYAWQFPNFLQYLCQPVPFPSEAPSSSTTSNGRQLVCSLYCISACICPRTWSFSSEHVFKSTLLLTSSESAKGFLQIVSYMSDTEKPIFATWLHFHRL